MRSRAAPSAAWVRVTAPVSTPSVAAISASVESSRLAPSIAPAAVASLGGRKAAAPQAQAAAASIAPAIDGSR